MLQLLPNPPKWRLFNPYIYLDTRSWIFRGEMLAHGKSILFIIITHLFIFAHFCTPSKAKFSLRDAILIAFQWHLITIVFIMSVHSIYHDKSRCTKVRNIRLLCCAGSLMTSAKIPYVTISSLYEPHTAEAMKWYNNNNP